MLALPVAQVYASQVGSEPKPSPRTDDKAPLDDLDIDAQIDDLAAALQFELDDDEAEEDDGLGADDDLALPDDPPTVVEGRAPSLAALAAHDDLDLPDDPPTLAEPTSAEDLEPDDDLALASEDDPETYVGAEPLEDSIIAEFDAETEFDAEEVEELDAEDLDEVPETTSGAIDTGSEPRREPVRPLYLKVEGQVAKVDTDRFVIGRVSKMCDFAIIDVNISRQHCAIERRDGRYYIVDLGSTNGVQVDGERVDNHEIAEGDVFVLSGHEMRASFFAPLPDARPAAASVAPASEPSVPHVTGRLEPVPVAQQVRTSPARPAPEPAAATPGPQPSSPPVGFGPMTGGPGFTQAVVDPLGPEAKDLRLEHKIDQLIGQVAYLQQAVQVLMARTEALSGLGPLANMIQSRLGQRRGQ